MTDGAVGFSTGLQYVPGTYARTPEIFELARVAGERRRRLRVAHAERGHGARGGYRRDDPGRASHRRARADLAPEGRQPQPLGRQREGARADRCRAGERHRRRGRSVCLHRRQLHARHPLSGVGARGWAEQIAERLNDPATWAGIKKEMAALLAERGLTDLSFAVVASSRSDPSLNGLSMKQVALKLKGAETRPTRSSRRHATMMLAGGASMVYHFMSDDDVDRIMRHPQVAIASDSSVLTLGRRRAASARLRQQRARAGRLRAQAPASSRSKKRSAR